MYDSRTDAPHKGVHAARANYKREDLFIGYSMSNPLYRLMHQMPALDIAAGIREYQDDVEEANCLADGLDIAPVTRTEREPYRTESPGYDVRTRAALVMARIDAADRAKRTSRDYVPTPQRASYGSLIQRRTRR